MKLFPKLLIITASAILFTSCGVNSKAKKEVGNELRDSATAKWKDFTPYIGKDGRKYGVCGYLNAKNAFGAYIGWTPFIYSWSKDKKETFIDILHGNPPNPELIELWNVKCLSLIHI